ncbi:hydroxymethylpyrimidine pyrophosphatase-like HAD family hydrolase [Paenibacillus phyllosphaerae]|uniref:Hydroxymethylpyrimidine pyrophosphatase-like HAD family hydrolase n=1 Tax=Paenibacillus phyllosphaerae TaxID=274593 RepID=A0A7W5AWG6_9BACL|nr:HAD family hydrolase [Paenibacillus phyllosphaerae]MBB3109749.1 hydroxymethylpyrimidine pyrophosphatase-like HAD family hydrolase [Paenibacillus phyllosphaerae]
MIFASDLDQTLIYSIRSIGLPLDSPLVMPAETIEGKVRSYISIQAYEQLKIIAQEMMFVPVTTRTVEQYRRIELFQERIRPQYAVTSNGGNVLIHGEPDPEWNARIRRTMLHQAASSEEVQRIYRKVVHGDWVLREDLCDDLFYSILIERERMPLEDVMQLADVLQQLGWETSIQGRKIYMVPCTVKKSDALAHIKELAGVETVIASGDSLLDRCLLDYATHPIAPRHGELYRVQESNPGTFPYPFTAVSGALAAEQIVAYAASVQAEALHSGKLIAKGSI